MLIGSLRRRFTLQKKTLSTSVDLGTVSSWVDVCSFRAALEPVQRTTKIYVNEYESRVTHTVTLRYRQNCEIAEGMRLVSGARTFFVRAIQDPDERQRWVRLLVEENGSVGE